MAFGQGNAPQRLGLSDVIANIGQGGGWARSSRFVVKFDAVGSRLAPLLSNNNLYYMCDAAELPGRGFAVNTVRYYGPQLGLPNNTEYQTANFSFLCRVNGIERRLFDDWMEIINPTSNWSFAYANEYWGSIKVYQLGETGKSDKSTAPQVMYSWRLNNAWPILVSPQQVTWADQDVLRLQVVFNYKYWDRPDMA